MKKLSVLTCLSLFMLVLAANSQAAPAPAPPPPMPAPAPKIAPLNLDLQQDHKTWLTLGGFSKHDGNRLDNGQHYNEVNPGLGIEYGFDSQTSFSLGTFKNSYAKESFYGAVFRQFAGDDQYRFGLSGGLFTGYKYAVITPGLMPTFMFEKEKWGLNFYYSPSFSRAGKRISNDALLMQLKIRF